MKFFTFCIFLFLFPAFNINAANCTLIASTNWTVAASWSCGHVPTGADNIVIPSGYTVTITTSIDLSAGTLTQMDIGGGLFFSGNTSTLKLPTSATVTLSSTGTIYTDVGNNSQKFKIGNNTIWTSQSGTVTGPSVATSSSGALPVELIDFYGTCLTNGVELNWSTASEENNDYFLLEKSLNGSEWQQISKVAGHGTSGVVNKYIHIDYSDDEQLMYYRLSQVDKSGVKEVFKAIDVNCKNVKDQIVLYPNPSSSEVNILLDVTTSSNNNFIRILDNVGQVVMETKVDVVKGVNTFVLPIDITSGTYNVMFSSDNIVLPSQKLLIIK